MLLSANSCANEDIARVRELKMAEVGFSAIDKNCTIRDRHFELMLSGIRFVLEPMRLPIDIDGHPAADRSMNSRYAE